MNNYIVKENYSTIRENARMHLKNNWMKVTLGVALGIILMAMIPLFFELVLPQGFGVEEKIINLSDYISYTSKSTSWLGRAYQLFFSGVFSVGLASFMLNFVRLKRINAGNIFNGFEYYLKTLALNFMISLFVFLWTLLFIIPGIIAIYRYSQAFYLLADNPDKGIMECITESKLRMRGNKATLFILQLTFIGWAFLAALPLSFMLAFLPDNPNMLMFFIVYFIGFIPFYPLIAYEKTSETIFYELLTGHMRPTVINISDMPFADNNRPVEVNDESQDSQE